MQNNVIQIDLWKLIKYMLKRCWVMIILAVIGFGAMYYRTEKNHVDSFTASATIYVNNNNPNLINYQYTSSADLMAATQLIETYSIVIRSDKVLDAVRTQLVQNAEIPGFDMNNAQISATLNMSSVNETGVCRISCTTGNAILSREICNAVVDIAPEEIKRVVGAGSVEVIDYAAIPMMPNGYSLTRQGAIGALAGIVLGGAILLVFFLLDRRVDSEKELHDRYDVSVLASIMRMDSKNELIKKKKKKRENSKSDMDDGNRYLVAKHTPETIREAYKHLRTNLRFAMVKQESKVLVVSSAVPGEGKSTISANIAIVSSQAEQKVLLIDGDMRKPRQHRMFMLNNHENGLSDLLVGDTTLEAAVHRDVMPGLDILCAGSTPPNPSELLGSEAMLRLIEQANQEYDLVILDTPPVNIATDALVLSDKMAGLLFVVRQDYSEHPEIRKALQSVEFTGGNLLGFVYSTKELNNRSYYYKHYYHRYYRKYYSHYYGDHHSGETKKG